MNRLKILGCVLAAALFLAGLATAQDSHYWTYQYGTRSNLLGGAVIGSVLDLSGTYYNPGGLSLIETDSVELLMFAKVFHYPKVTLGGLGPQNVKLTSTELAEAPTLFAGSLPLKGLGKHWLGYSFINRSYTKMELSGTIVTYLDLDGELPSANDVQLFEKLSEPWYGVTWAYKLSDKVGIGVSQYLTYRHQYLNYHINSQALLPDGRVRFLVDSRAFRYDHYGLLWKIGAAFDFDRITLGLTLTTPRIHIFSLAKSGLNTTVIRQDPEKNDMMIVDFQDKLAANYRSPLSLALGVTFKLKQSKLYASAEWFSGIDKYTVIKGENFEGQSSGEILPNEVTHEVAQVFNMALGAEHRLSSHFTLYGSFWTDNSSHPGNTKTNLTVADWDIYHVMGGTTVTFKNTTLTLGIGYAYGSEGGGSGSRIPRQAGLAIENFASSFFSDLVYTYSSFVWVFGFTF